MFYLIIMENLVNCSRVLYDKDIVEKMEEIKVLKNKLKCMEWPETEFLNVEELDNERMNVGDIVDASIKKFVFETDWEEVFMDGIFSYNMIDFLSGIEKSLNSFTKNVNPEWANYESNQIVVMTRCHIESLELHHYLDTEDLDKLSDSIFRLIISYLENTLFYDVQIIEDDL